MPHRQFTDANHVSWEVWDVHPGEIDRQLRVHADPARADAIAIARPRAGVSRDLATGWLCFESLELKRRLSPIPAGWERMNDAQLADLCAKAKDAPAR